MRIGVIRLKVYHRLIGGIEMVGLKVLSSTDNGEGF